MLIRWLPSGSALHRAMDPEGSGWSVDSYLLANVIDLVAAGNWQQANAGRKQPSQRPQPMWRPPAPGTPRRKSLEEQIAHWKKREEDRQAQLAAQAGR